MEKLHPKCESTARWWFPPRSEQGYGIHLLLEQSQEQTLASLNTKIIMRLTSSCLRWLIGSIFRWARIININEYKFKKLQSMINEGSNYICVAHIYGYYTLMIVWAIFRFCRPPLTDKDWWRRTWVFMQDLLWVWIVFYACITTFHCKEMTS